jgi:hypothetical protein
VLLGPIVVIGATAARTADRDGLAAAERANGADSSYRA